MRSFIAKRVVGTMVAGAALAVRKSEGPPPSTPPLKGRMMTKLTITLSMDVVLNDGSSAEDIADAIVGGLASLEIQDEIFAGSDCLARFGSGSWSTAELQS